MVQPINLPCRPEIGQRPDVPGAAGDVSRDTSVIVARVRLLPFLAFFLSGASGLVFQTIWSRLLHHVFGSSSVAISSVVSAFMTFPLSGKTP